MLRDRGSIKWTSLMLPEHVQMLKELWEEMEKKPPIHIDEQMFDELNLALKEAWEQKKKVRLTINVNGQSKEMIGRIKEICVTNQRIKLDSAHSDNILIDTGSIVRLEGLDY